MGKNFLRIIFLTNLLCVAPFRVDKKVGKIYTHLGSRCRVVFIWSWWLGYAIIALPNHLYLLYCSKELKKFNFTMIIQVGCCAATLIIGSNCVKAEEVCQTYNAIYKFLPDFKEKYMQKYDFRKSATYNRILEILMVITVSGSFILTSFIAIHSYLRPTASPYVLFRVEKRLITWPIYLIGASWQAFFAVGFGSAIGMLGYNGVVFFGYILPIIRNETRMGLLKYKTCSSLRENPFNLVTTWRSIEILVKALNLAMGFSLLYLQVFMIEAILFVAVTLVYQWSISDNLIKALMIFAGIVCFFGWAIFLSLAGFQYKWSKETIRSWKSQHWRSRKDFEYMKRVVLSCTPFSLGDGKRYFIQPISTLRFFRSVSRNTFRALITYVKTVDLEKFI